MILTRHVIAPIALLDTAHTARTDFCCPGDERVACGFFLLLDTRVRPILISKQDLANGKLHIPVLVLSTCFLLVPPHKVQGAMAPLALRALEARVREVVHLSRLAASGNAPAPVGDLVIDGLGLEFAIAKINISIYMYVINITLFGNAPNKYMPRGEVLHIVVLQSSSTCWTVDFVPHLGLEFGFDPCL